MNIPTEIIQIAIKGGWKPDANFSTEWLNNGLPVPDEVQKSAVLSPLFFQALGKELHWEKTIDPVLVGERIRKERLALGLRQDELGKQIGYSPMGISHFEKGVRTIKVSTIDKLCRFFKKEPSYFVCLQDPCITNAHRLYDLILTQQPTQPFWEEITANYKGK